jgi:hypothetical protein
VPPRAEQTHAQINATINVAVREDARIGELIGFARQLLATSDAEPADPPDEFWQAIEAAGELLSKTKAGEVLPRSECVRFAYLFSIIEFPRAEDGTLLPVKGELIVTGIPGIEGRPLWLLRDEADIEAMRGELAPGQVWIRADLVKADDCQKVISLASDQVRRVLGQVRRAGRPKGWRSAARSELIGRVREDPEISDAEIDRLGVYAGLWENSSRDYVLVADRARRIRRSAGS